MSFIRDAVRNSGLERQRQSVPGLVDSGIARRRPGLPAWAIALGLLLALNLLVLLFVVMRSFLASPHVQTTTAPPRVAAAAVGVADPAGAESQGTLPPGVAAPAAGDGRFSPLDAPVYAPDVPVASAPPAAARIPGPEL